MDFKNYSHLKKVQKIGVLTFTPKTVSRVNVYLNGVFYCYCTFETYIFFSNN